MLLGLNQGRGRKCHPIGNLKDYYQLTCYYIILRYEKIGYWVIFVFCDNKYVRIIGEFSESYNGYAMFFQ